MLVCAHTPLRHESSVIPHFFKRKPSQIFVRTSHKVSCLPVDRALQDDVEPRLRYKKQSFRVIDKMRSDGVLQASSHELPLSSYETAMEALSSLITRQKRGDKSNIGGSFGKLDRMHMYVKILGLEEHIADLKIIHVAGTKGKGSTCAFCEAILRESGFRTGLFTSPHLIDVRERFRVDGLDISEDKFLQYFWDCWHQLKENITEDLPMPPLFQFLTVLAFKIFVCEKVDVAIIEVGLGGTTDSTNVIKEPVVCGIASLGMDHTESLGDSLGQIASHKAGIMKPQVPAFTVPQLSEAMDVLQGKASESMVPLKVVPPLDPKKLGGLKLSLSGDHQYTNAGLAVALCRCWLQKTVNSKEPLTNEKAEAYLPESFLRGLSTARLSGRAQIVYDSVIKANSPGGLVFYLDGAHSPESMEVCARWFSDAVNEDIGSSTRDCIVGESRENSAVQHKTDFYDSSRKISKQILLFNCMEVRDPQILLPKLVSTCASSGVHFSKALFVPSMSTYSKVTSAASIVPSNIPTKDLSWQSKLQKIWDKIIHRNDTTFDENLKMENPEMLPSSSLLNWSLPHKCNPVDNPFAGSAVMPSLPLTIKWLRDCAKENPSVRLQVLVTGSLHLVGDVLKLLKK